MEEIWKDIPNHTDYQASNFGNIRSKDRLIAPGRGVCKRKRKSQLIKHSFDGGGYCQVLLGASHPKGLSRKVHRLVMLSFVGESDLEVNHKDGNKENNRLDNLEYVTHSQNHIYARNTLKRLTGTNHWNHRISESEIKEMKEKYKSGLYTFFDLGVLFGCSYQHAHYLVKKK